MGRKDRLDMEDYRALAAFRYALRRFLSFSERAAREEGLTPQQHQALLAIHGYPSPTGITVGDMAERLQLRHHSAVGLADRLVALGLILRRRDPHDRRRVRVRLTPKGRRLLERLTRAHRDELRSVGPQIVAALERAALATDRDEEG